MPFLGLDYAPPTPVERLLQQDRLAFARAAAEAVPQKNLMQGLGSLIDELSGLLGLDDLGAAPQQKPAWLIAKERRLLKKRFNPAKHQQSYGGASVTPPKPKPQTYQEQCTQGGGAWTGAYCQMPYGGGYYPPSSPGTPVPSPMSGLGNLGAMVPRQGTKAWWVWYATQYLPQYYSQQQIYQYVQQSPYYQYFGSPFNYAIPQQYGYGSSYSYNPYGYQQPINYGYGYTGSPSYNQYGYQYDPYSQAQYTQYVGEQGSAACAAGGGYYDYAQGTCSYTQGYPYGGTSYGTVQSYGPGSSPPNVVGMSEGQAIQALNSTGFNVWELNVNGQSRGVPPGYSQNRVSISVKNGVVDSQAVG